MSEDVENPSNDDHSPQIAERKRTISPKNGSDVTRFQFKRGNPGRPAFGAVVIEWMNAMADYTAADLEVVITDPDQPSAKVSAARQVLGARNGQIESHREMCDRTYGKPVQATINVDATERIKRVLIRDTAEN